MCHTNSNCYTRCGRTIYDRTISCYPASIGQPCEQTASNQNWEDICGSCQQQMHSYDTSSVLGIEGGKEEEDEEEKQSRAKTRGLSEE